MSFNFYFSQFHMPKELNPAGEYIHLSIDDTIDVFADLTVNKDLYDSIFNQPELSFLKELHDQYGIVVSMYCFYSYPDGTFTLADVTDKYAYEISKNANWLRFGFHAKDYLVYENITTELEIEYYNKTVAELIRICGSEECIDNYVRLDRYIATKDMCLNLKDCNEGIIGLLIADDKNRESYGLTQEERNECYEEDYYIDSYGIEYTPTDIRIENIEDDNNFYECLKGLESQPRIEIFTHAFLLNDEKVRKYMEWFSIFAVELEIPFVFTEDL